MEEIGQVNQLRGRVVDDEGRGVSAVAVANGELIERTDASGGYEIEVREGIHRFLTVTVPRGARHGRCALEAGRVVRDQTHQHG